MGYDLGTSIVVWNEGIAFVDVIPLAGEAVLGRKELQVVNLIRDGLSNKQIAKQLCLSIFTVKNHVHNIVEKLGVRNRYEAARMLEE